MSIDFLAQLFPARDNASCTPKLGKLMLTAGKLCDSRDNFTRLPSPRLDRVPKTFFLCCKLSENSLVFVGTLQEGFLYLVSDKSGGPMLNREGPRAATLSGKPEAGQLEPEPHVLCMTLLTTSTGSFQKMSIDTLDEDTWRRPRGAPCQARPTPGSRTTFPKKSFSDGSCFQNPYQEWFAVGAPYISRIDWDGTEATGDVEG